MRDSAAAATMIATVLLGFRLKATGESPDEKNIARCFDAAELVIREAMKREAGFRKMEDDHRAARGPTDADYGR